MPDSVHRTKTTYFKMFISMFTILMLAAIPVTTLATEHYTFLSNQLFNTASLANTPKNPNKGLENLPVINIRKPTPTTLESYINAPLPKEIQPTIQLRKIEKNSYTNSNPSPSIIPTVYNSAQISRNGKETITEKIEIINIKDNDELSGDVKFDLKFTGLLVPIKSGFIEIKGYKKVNIDPEGPFFGVINVNKLPKGSYNVVEAEIHTTDNKTFKTNVIVRTKA